MAKPPCAQNAEQLSSRTAGPAARGRRERARSGAMGRAEPAPSPAFCRCGTPCPCSCPRSWTGRGRRGRARSTYAHLSRVPPWLLWRVCMAVVAEPRECGRLDLRCRARIVESQNRQWGLTCTKEQARDCWFPAVRKAGGCDTVAGTAKPVVSTPFLLVPDQPHPESGCCPPSSPAEPASTPRHCSCSVGLLTVAATMVLLVAEL